MAKKRVKHLGTWSRDLVACVNARSAESFILHIIRSKIVLITFYLILRSAEFKS